MPKRLYAYTQTTVRLYPISIAKFYSDTPSYFSHHNISVPTIWTKSALAIYFSTPKGKSENDTACTFIQARLRFGAEEWDMPELFMNTMGANDQSALLWQDAGRLWFFGGGRDISSYVPFRMADGITRHYNEQGRLTATYHFKNGILQEDHQQGSSGLVGDM